MPFLLFVQVLTTRVIKKLREYQLHPNPYVIVDCYYIHTSDLHIYLKHEQNQLCFDFFSSSMCIIFYIIQLTTKNNIFNPIQV